MVDATGGREPPTTHPQEWSGQDRAGVGLMPGTVLVLKGRELSTLT